MTTTTSIPRGRSRMLKTILLLLLLTLTTTTNALPLSNWFRSLNLPLTTSRAFTLPDLDGTYTSTFRFSASCPSTVTISNTRLVQEDMLAVTDFEDIKINGATCQGVGSMRSVTEATARQAPRLASLGLTNFVDGLNANTVANSVLKGGVNETEVVVGFDGAVRNCGAGGTWPADTFYFFIREERGFNITIGTSAQKTTTTIPGNKKGLFIVESVAETARPRLCILLAPLAGDGDGAMDASPDADSGATESPDADAGMGGGGVVGGDGAGPSATPESTDDGMDTGGGLPGATGGGDGDMDASATPTTDEDGQLPIGGGTGGLTGTETPEPTDDGAVCFPGFAQVELEDGTMKNMEDIDVGDMVRTSGDTFSEVFMFTHRHADIKYKFMELETAAGQKITLTPGHYIHVGKFGESKLVQSRFVNVGDTVTLGKSNEETGIIAKRTVESIGLYNPQTMDGSIVVDGVRASAYTDAVHPWFAHNVLLRPVRWLYAQKIVRKPFESVFDMGNDLLAGFAPSGPKELL